MTKGQAGILFLIVFLALIAVIFLPQIFTGQPPPTSSVNFRNDIITIENLEISNLKPLEKGKLTINFDLVNNGDKTVDVVVIDFGGTSQLPNLQVVECEEGVEEIEEERMKRLWKIPIPFTSEDAKRLCIFENIPSLDTRKVVAEYEAPSAGSANIEIKVNYPYNGSREILIPIIDDTTIKRPPRQFEQSTPSFGPFVVDVIPPTKGWTIGDQDFEIKFKLRFVGSVAEGKPTTDLTDLKIEKGNFTAKLDGFQIIRCPQLTGEEGGDTITNSDRDIIVNKEYSCNLQATDVERQFGYKLGVVRIDFLYNYEYTKSQTIVVRPSP